MLTVGLCRPPPKRISGLFAQTATKLGPLGADVGFQTEKQTDVDLAVESRTRRGGTWWALRELAVVLGK